MQKIDAFPHILPRPVLERMLAVVPNGPARHWVEGTAGQPGLTFSPEDLEKLFAGNARRALGLAS